MRGEKSSRFATISTDSSTNSERRSTNACKILSPDEYPKRTGEHQTGRNNSFEFCEAIFSSRMP